MSELHHQTPSEFLSELRAAAATTHFAQVELDSLMAEHRISSDTFMTFEDKDVAAKYIAALQRVDECNKAVANLVLVARENHTLERVQEIVGVETLERI